MMVDILLPAPHSPEPYLTLSTVYEEKGDTQKLLQVPPTHPLSLSLSLSLTLTLSLSLSLSCLLPHRFLSSPLTSRETTLSCGPKLVSWQRSSVTSPWLPAATNKVPPHTSRDPFSLAFSFNIPACRFEPANLMYVWKKASLYQSMGEAGKAITTYQQLLQVLSMWSIIVMMGFVVLCFRCCHQPMVMTFWKFTRS